MFSITLLEKHCGRGRRSVPSRPEKIPDVFHPLLGLSLRRPGQDQALPTPVQGERKIVGPETGEKRLENIYI